MIELLLWGLVWTLAALVALPVLALCVPVHLWLRAGAEGVEMEVRLISARLPAVWRGKPGAGSEAPEREGPKKTPKQKRRRKRGGGFARRFVPRAVAALPALLADTLRGVHLDRLSARGRFGLGDPAETGAAFGRLCPLLYAPLPDKVQLDLAPDFDLTGFEGEAELRLHAVPIRLAWPTLRTGARLAWEAA